LSIRWCGPALDELFEMFSGRLPRQCADRFRDRWQFWTISTHDHLLLKSDRCAGREVSQLGAFSVRYCLSANPETLEVRLKSLSDGTVRMVCMNHLETVVVNGAGCDVLSVGPGQLRPSKSSPLDVRDGPDSSGVGLPSLLDDQRGEHAHEGCLQ
jgi:hypothetical protein